MGKIASPWIIMGDFNTLMDEEDRISGAPVHESNFRGFMNNIGIAEIKTIGRRYTWTNNHIHSKID